MVSSDLGKLEARRQRTVAWACTAGATPAAEHASNTGLFNEGTTIHVIFLSMLHASSTTPIGMQLLGQGGRALRVSREFHELGWLSEFHKLVQRTLPTKKRYKVPCPS